MNKKLLALYGLKWNPFAPDVPVEALHVTPRIESFCWRVQQLVGEGGFALVTGAPGAGKSVTLRILTERLAAQRDVKVGVCSRPQANLADFYREMGDLFGVELRPHNRWAGAKVLRERWQTHIDASLARPVLVVDEVDEAEVPAGVTNLDARQMPVAVGQLEAAPLDHDGSVAFALHAVIGTCEGEAQRIAVGAGPCHLGTREEARDGGLADLGVDLAVGLVLDPGLRRLVEERQRQIGHVLQHGDQPALDRTPERLLLGVLVVMWLAT